MSSFLLCLDHCLLPSITKMLIEDLPLPELRIAKSAADEAAKIDTALRSMKESAQSASSADGSDGRLEIPTAVDGTSQANPGALVNYLRQLRIILDQRLSELGHSHDTIKVTIDDVTSATEDLRQLALTIASRSSSLASLKKDQSASARAAIESISGILSTIDLYADTTGAPAKSLHGSTRLPIHDEINEPLRRRSERVSEPPSRCSFFTALEFLH